MFLLLRRCRTGRTAAPVSAPPLPGCGGFLLRKRVTGRRSLCSRTTIPWLSRSSASQFRSRPNEPLTIGGRREPACCPTTLIWLGPTCDGVPCAKKRAAEATLESGAKPMRGAGAREPCASFYKDRELEGRRFDGLLSRSRCSVPAFAGADSG
jgi:hypothetical protein